jgi:uncharacterized delta-60 repeat protein
VLTATGPSSSVSDVVVDARGRIVAAGFTRILGGAAFAVARYLPDGRRDPGFGTDVITTPIGSSSVGVAVAVQSDGRIVVGGYSDSRFAVVRYDEDGTLDASRFRDLLS